MITTSTAPPWLRRSDQAVTSARTMLSPHRAVVIDCETTDLPWALTGKVIYSNLPNTDPEPSGLRSRESLSVTDARALHNVNDLENGHPSTA
jgi:hypothetical protein